GCLARCRSRQQHIVIVHEGRECVTTFCGECTRVAIALECARETALQTSIAQGVAELVPVTLDLISEIARKLEARDGEVSIHELFEFSRQVYIADFRARFCELLRRILQ